MMGYQATGSVTGIERGGSLKNKLANLEVSNKITKNQKKSSPMKDALTT